MSFQIINFAILEKVFFMGGKCPFREFLENMLIMLTFFWCPVFDTMTSVITEYPTKNCSI